jgi:hypothetical protein
VRWSPRPVFVGAPVLFRSKTYSGPAIWLGRRIEFRRDGDVFSALAGVSLKDAPGRYPLVFGGDKTEVTVTDHAYPYSNITVPQKFVAPPKEIQAQIDEEVAIKQEVFKSSPPERLWQGPFIPPASTRYTSSFGARRVYNGKTRFIVIDHGESIFTLYMHLSELLVKEGAAIEKGAPIAKSGSSGRVTGPHLHFGVRWQDLYLEPSTLLGLWQRETA